jgi:hypothetical protein
MSPKNTRAKTGLTGLANDRVAVLAAFLAAISYADTEDIAVQAAQLTPGRFSWRKYPDQINIETVRKRLWDAASEKKGRLLVGSEREGWLLTEAGLQFCRENEGLLAGTENTAVRLSQKELAWSTREKARMQAEVAFKKWREGHAEEILPVEAERFFRIDDYVVGLLRRSRVERAVAVFAADSTMTEAIEAISTKVRDRD